MGPREVFLVMVLTFLGIYLVDKTRNKYPYIQRGYFPVNSMDCLYPDTCEHTLVDELQPDRIFAHNHTYFVNAEALQQSVPQFHISLKNGNHTLWSVHSKVNADGFQAITMAGGTARGFYHALHMQLSNRVNTDVMLFIGYRVTIRPV